MKSKNKIGLLTGLLSLALLPACQQSPGETYGEQFTPQGVVTTAELPDRMAGQRELKVTVQGTVDEVCQMEGCWLTMPMRDGSTMMVRTKDHRYSVPKSISGKEVIVTGTAFYDTATVAELRHLAEDAGKSQAEIDAINQPKVQLSLLAEGIIVRP